jgi:predicted RND superfamily exporter protein
MDLLARLFVRLRPLVGLFLLLVTGAATAGYLLPAKSIHPLDKYNTDIDTDLPSVGDQVTNRFDLARSDAFVVVEVDDLFRPSTVAALRAMVEGVREIEFVDTLFWVDDVPVLNVFGFADPMLPPADASALAFEQARDRVLSHPLVRGQLLSPDGKTLLMPLVYDWLAIAGAEATTAANEQRMVDEVIAEARRAIDESQATLPADEQSNIRVRLTGNVPLFLAQRSAFDRNQIFFQSLGYLLAFVLSIIMFRGVAAVFVISAAPMLSIYWALGLVRLFGFETNPLADVVMPVLISMIALTDGVHLLVHIRRQRAAGAEPIVACESAIKHVGLACWLTSLTTAIGFASLLVTETRYVREFGAACCFGVFVAFLAVVLFVPFICSTWVGRYVDRGHQGHIAAGLSSSLTRLIDWLIARRLVVTTAAVVMTVVFGWISLTLTPDNQLASAMPASSEAYQALVHTDRHLGGIEFVQLEIRWPELVGDESPQILAALREAEAILNNEPLLEFPLSVRNLLATFPGDADDLVTQASFLSLLPVDLRSFFYRPDENVAVVVVRMQDRGIAAYTPVFDRVEQQLLALSESSFAGFEFALEGRPVEVSRDLYKIVLDLRWSLCTASVIILVVLAMAYRSLKVGLVSVVPNLLPLVATGTLLVGMGQSLDMSSVCAFVVCLGIAVDDTIHFLSRFKQELATDGDGHRAIHRAMVGVGSALVMTTIILVTGFGTMLFSDLPGHRTFAAMACATIGSALVGDLLALPAILAVAWPQRSAQRQMADSFEPRK